MPEIEFTVDETTGALTAHVKGVAGPSCGDIQKLLEALLGGASKEEKTPEFYRRVVTQQRVRGGAK